MSRTPRHPFHGLLPPPAPADLRRRVLDAARAVPAEPAGAPRTAPRGLTDRLWESLPLRLAWALLVLLLLSTNAFLDSAARAPGAARPAPEPGRVRLLDAHEAVLRALLDGDPGLHARRVQGRSS